MIAQQQNINIFVNSQLQALHAYLSDALSTPLPPPPIYENNFSSTLFANLNQVRLAIEADDLDAMTHWGAKLFSSDYTQSFYNISPLQFVSDPDTQALFLNSDSLYQEDLKREFAQKDAQYDFPTFKNHFEKAVGLIAQLTPDFYHEMQLFIKEVYILNQRPPKQGSGIGLFGALFFSHEVLNRSIVDAYERIIHESAHMTLYAYSFEDPLVENTLEEQYNHGLREDKRPMIAVYHACFVLTRIIYGLEALCNTPKTGDLSPDDYARAQTLLSHYHERLALSLEPLKAHGKLTNLGYQLMAPLLNKTKAS